MIKFKEILPILHVKEIYCDIWFAGLDISAVKIKIIFCLFVSKNSCYSQLLNLNFISAKNMII
jgi:hypothetical protein